MKKIILASILIVTFSAVNAAAVTVTVAEKIPLNPDSLRKSLAEKDARLASFDAELLIYGYSTGKEIIRLTPQGELDVKNEAGEIEAVIKFKGANSSRKPLFIKGSGYDQPSLSAAIIEETVKALTPYLP